jgi:hypothetical protein
MTKLRSLNNPDSQRQTVRNPLRAAEELADKAHLEFAEYSRKELARLRRWTSSDEVVRFEARASVERTNLRFASMNSEGRVFVAGLQPQIEDFDPSSLSYEPPPAFDSSFS